MSEDFPVIKNTRLTEKISTELVGQFINLFNRHRFGGMDPNFSNATFGRATVVSFPRFIQLGARVRF